PTAFKSDSRTVLESQSGFTGRSTSHSACVLSFQDSPLRGALSQAESLSRVYSHSIGRCVSASATCGGSTSIAGVLQYQDTCPTVGNGCSSSLSLSLSPRCLSLASSVQEERERERERETLLHGVTLAVEGSDRCMSMDTPSAASPLVTCALPLLGSLGCAYPKDGLFTTWRPCGPLLSLNPLLGPRDKPSRQAYATGKYTSPCAGVEGREYPPSATVNRVRNRFSRLAVSHFPSGLPSILAAESAAALQLPEQARSAGYQRPRLNYTSRRWPEPPRPQEPETILQGGEVGNAAVGRGIRRAIAAQTDRRNGNIARHVRLSIDRVTELGYALSLSPLSLETFMLLFDMHIANGLMYSSDVCRYFEKDPPFCDRPIKILSGLCLSWQHLFQMALDGALNRENMLRLLTTVQVVSAAVDPVRVAEVMTASSLSTGYMRWMVENISPQNKGQGFGGPSSATRMGQQYLGWMQMGSNLPSVPTVLHREMHCFPVPALVKFPYL
ncbi:hypothetical protein KIPB_007774, partial [Kipferlia bialata]